MYQVVATDAATEDLIEILDYVRLDSPGGAERLMEHFASAVACLADFPNRCPVAPESTEWGCTVRSMLVFNYRVLYSVKQEQVRVLRVVHGRRERPVGFPR